MIAESIFPVSFHLIETKTDKRKTKKKAKDLDKEVGNCQKSAPCEDRTHDLQISTNSDYETDALPTALTRHL